MPLDPFYEERLRLVAGFDRERASRTDPDTRARVAGYRSDGTEAAVSHVDDVESEDLVIEGRHGAIPLRRYRPRGSSSRGAPYRALLWVHGGGFQQGTLDWAESHVVASELAVRAVAEVISVDYRLAVGGVRFPVPLDDVHDAAVWLQTAVPETTPIAIGGASAGAALAVGAALRLNESSNGHSLAALLLAYPLLHFPVPPLDDETAAAIRLLPPMLRFQSEHVRGIVRNYVGRIHDVPRLALPGHAPLVGLPPVHMVVAEYDELRPSAELFAEQLKEVGVPVAMNRAAGVVHGHLNRTIVAPRVAESLDFFATALRALG